MPSFAFAGCLNADRLVPTQDTAMHGDGGLYDSKVSNQLVLGPRRNHH
jgi:hypothetical protein